jgi:hypothetical protein
VRLGLLPDAERARAARRIADLARAHGDRRAEIDALARLRDELPADDTAGVDAELRRALAELPTPVLLQVAEGLGSRGSAALVWLEIGERALAEGDRALAIRAFSRAERARLAPSDSGRRERIAATLEGREAPGGLGDAPPRLSDLGGELALADTEGLSGAIGVVLPLSGPFASVAEQTLRGVLLAAGVFGPGAGAGAVEAAEAAPAGGLRVLVRDSGGTPAGAADAVRVLAAQPDVTAVVGPLLTEEVQAAADAAQESGLPLLALTRHESVVRPGANVFRFALTRRMEADDPGRARGAGPRPAAGRDPVPEGRLRPRVRGAAVAGGRGAGRAHRRGRRLRAGRAGPDRADPSPRRLVAARRGAARAARGARGGAGPGGRGRRARRGAPRRSSARASRSRSPRRTRCRRSWTSRRSSCPTRPTWWACWRRSSPCRAWTAWCCSARAPGTTRSCCAPAARASRAPSSPRPSTPRTRRRWCRSSPAATATPSARTRRCSRPRASTPPTWWRCSSPAAPATASRCGGAAGVPVYPGVSGATAFEPDGNARKRPFVLGVQSGQLMSLE